MKIKRLGVITKKVNAMFNKNKELYYKELQRDLDAAITKRSKETAEAYISTIQVETKAKIDFETLEDVSNELKGEGYFVDRLRREKELENNIER